MAVTDLTHHDGFTWVDIADPSSEELQEISHKYDLHEYTLRDCLEPDHLPKHEDLGHSHFLISRILTDQTHPRADSIQEMTNKVAIFYNKKFLITVHRRPQTFLKEIRDNFVATGRCRSTGAVVTRIMWHVLHSYDNFGVTLSSQIDQFEARVFLKPLNSVLIQDLYYIKRKASVSRKLLLLTGEVIGSIKTEDTAAHQDLIDLHVKLLNMFGQAQEDTTNLLNTYLSMTAQKTNDVMKVLTVFSVFFMPLTFIAGIYGMNFHYMPELGKKWGYPSALLLMSVTSLIIYAWFRRKKWL
jgi:magnesium transporter